MLVSVRSAYTFENFMYAFVAELSARGSELAVQNFFSTVAQTDTGIPTTPYLGKYLFLGHGIWNKKC